MAPIPLSSAPRAGATTSPGSTARVLHLGSGFRPWRRGGLVAYAEDLMHEQVRRGRAVSYLFCGRYYPWPRSPRLRRWERGGVAMREILSSPLYDHGRQPELEVSEPRLERLVRRVLEEERPDVVHVQELAGFPFSVLDVFRSAGVPTVVTLQDYFALCPTFKLLDAQGETCVRREIGADCVATTAADPRDPGLLFEATARYELEGLAVMRAFGPHRRRVQEALARRAGRIGVRGRPTGRRDAAAFQRRREAGIAALSSAERVVAMSARVRELHVELGVPAERIETMRLTLAHVEHLRPRRAAGTAPVTFATLGGGESTPKGAHVLLAAIRRLAHEVPGRFRVLLFGHVAPEVGAEASRMPGVEVRGSYRPQELDGLLEEVDVGLMPSVWEEAYGYAGVEFLAKGIPVVANALGGMPEYTRPGETGWLTPRPTADGLAEVMRGIVERPGQVAELNAFLRERRDDVILPFATHVDALDDLYRELT